MIIVRHLHRMAILGALTAGLECASAEASPLPKTGEQYAPLAAPLSLVQYTARRHPRWYYGPKWGGFGSAYRYTSPTVRSYRYSSPTVRVRRYPRWYYGTKWGGF